MNGVLEIRFDIYDYVINFSPIAFNFCFKLMLIVSFYKLHECLHWF